MKKLNAILIAIAIFSMGLPALIAQTPDAYEQHTLSDGSIETSYNQAGSKVTQTQHPDGTVETDTIDAAGNETITTQHPDGRVDVKNRTKK